MSTISPQVTHETQNGQEEESGERRKPMPGVTRHPERTDAISFLVQLGLFFSNDSPSGDFPFGTEVLGSVRPAPGGKGRHKPHSDPPTGPALLQFPFPVIQASWAIPTSRLLPSAHKSRGRSSGLVEKHPGTLQTLSRGCMGKEGERGIRRKFHVVPLITEWKERGESSNRAPPARPRSQL